MFGARKMKKSCRRLNLVSFFKYLFIFLSGMSSRTMPKWGHWFWITTLVFGFAGKSKNCKSSFYVSYGHLCICLYVLACIFPVCKYLKTFLLARANAHLKIILTKVHKSKGRTLFVVYV
jgi:hypothetical protein